MNRKRILIPLILLGSLAGLIVVKWIWDDQTFRAIRGYDDQSALNVRTISSINKTNYLREEFAFDGCPGEEVPVLALIPAGAPHRYPAVIFLYGIGMKMNFADRAEIGEAVTRAGFAMFVPEQFNRGQRRQQAGNRFREMLALRRRMVLTIHETRRLTDAIARRPDIDPNRIYLWGASFGAMTGCSAMAYDRRLLAGVFTLSGGDLRKMATDSPYCEKRPWFSWIKAVAPLAASFLRPFDPICHIGRIAPRPLLFQNLKNDELIPKSAADALYQAAGEPKRMLWYDGPHTRPERATIEKLVRDALAWLKERDKEIASIGARLKEPTR